MVTTINVVSRIAGRDGPGGGPVADRAGRMREQQQQKFQRLSHGELESHTGSRHRLGFGFGSTATSACGPKPGVAATGSPINIGTIDTHQPGTDFTDGPNNIKAYFDCVNANGGVNGHPLKLYVQLDRPAGPITAAAHKLIQSDHVVAIDGVFDLLECTLDAAYWKPLGIYEMDAGISPECWSTPNSAAVNMGPRYSSDGAVQYAINSVHASKIVFVQSNVPGTDDIAAGPAGRWPRHRRCRSPS